MVFGEGCGSRRGEFDMLMQENAVRRRKRGGGEFEGRQGGIIRKMTLAPDEAAWSGLVRRGPVRPGPSVQAWETEKCSCDPALLSL